MPENVFPLDQSKSMFDQEVPGHNRWHPDIPEIATVRPGTDFRMDCREWTDGQVKNTDDANDIRDIDLSFNHVLSGPVAVEGAEPGDILVVDILDMGPHLPNSTPPTTWPEPAGDTGDLRQGERRRFPDGPIPQRPQGGLGLPRHLRHLPPHPRRQVRRDRTSRPLRLRPFPQPSRRMEPPRAGANRHQPRPGTAARAPPGARKRAPRKPGR